MKALALLPSVCLAAGTTQEWPRPDQRLACGPLMLEAYVSRTAHLFHVVDQLSAWDNACHGQYREHLPLSSDDEERLAAYAAVRAERRWGQGLEQTFYAPLELEAAARAGERAKHVTREELAVILPVLEHFSARVDELLAAKRPVLEHALDGLDRARLTKAAEELAQFTGVKKLTVPVFPLASPTSGGGGMDGGRLRWELSEGRVSFSVLLHECTHAFLQPRDAELAALVERAPGLTLTLLGEGLAYAMAPGLYPDDEDSLARDVGRDLSERAAWPVGGYEWRRAFGLALRPLLAEALSTKAKLETFLPRARDAFLGLKEVLESRAQRGPPKLFIAGPAGEVVRERLLDSQYHIWIRRTNHDVRSYQETLPELGSGDLCVLLVALDDGERIPAAFAFLAPIPPAELERRLRAGQTVEEERAEAGRCRVILLGAPTAAALRELARTSARLRE